MKAKHHTSALVAACATLLAVLACSGLKSPTPLPTSTPAPSPRPTLTSTFTPVPTLPPTPAPSPRPTRSPISSEIPSLLFTRLDRQGAHLYTLSPSDGRLTQLTFGETFDLEGRWSPDYRQIAFLALDNANETIEIRVMNADGSHIRSLATLSFDVQVRDMRWSPDGSRLVFWGFFEDDAEVCVIDVETAQMRRVTDNEVLWDAYPFWHPDGERLYVVSDRTPDELGKQSDQIYLMNLEGNLETHISRATDEWTENTRPALSPDGQKLAWIAWNLFGDSQIGLIGSNLLLAEPDGRDVQVMAADLEVVALAWSPNSAYIALVVSERAPWGDKGHIYVLDVETGEHWQVSDPSADPLAGQIAWAPNSQGLCYIQGAEEDMVFGTLICVDVEGRERTAISPAPIDAFPDWGH